MVVLPGSTGEAQRPAVQRLMESALHGTRASAVLMDASDGNLLASYGPLDVASAPGSTLKPLVLQTALAAHVLTDRSTVLCRGDLVIDGHNLACTHPRDVLAMDARLALSNSCNTYFATLAERMPASVLLRGLRSYGLSPSTRAESPDKRALLALGVEGVVVTPRRLAAAYREMAQRLAPADAVRDGLLDSVQTGMAHAAYIDSLPAGVQLGGKTGTMHDRSDPIGDGWFAGVVFREGRAQEVLVLRLPGGNGADAARLAQRILRAQLVSEAKPTETTSR
jgi:cell division protein FtsI/penicillin-binding protein 2